jgi:hypothetical protein
MISVNFSKNFRKIPPAQTQRRQGEMPLKDISDRTLFQFYFLFRIAASLPAVSFLRAWSVFPKMVSF